MKVKLLIILISFLSLLKCNNFENHLSSPVATQSGDNNSQSQIRTARRLLEEIHTGNYSEKEQAKVALIKLCQEDSVTRVYVVSGLIKFIDSQNIKANLIPFEVYDEWRIAAEILGSLQVDEAIGVLITYLPCNSGKLSLSTSRFPAARALVNYGDRVVPNLREALLKGRPDVRYVAAITLGEIGGAEARIALKRGLRKEQNEQVLNMIKAILENHIQ